MATNSKESAQLIFFQQLKSVLPPSISMVDALADLLQLSNDSVYRRLRGETALSIEEISAICIHFKISFDSFIQSGNDGQVNFSYHQLNSGVNSFQDYLTSIKKDLEKLTQFPESQIIFAAEDVPVFHHFEQPLLAAFKIFYWNKSFLNNKELENQKFDSKLIPQDLIDLGKAVYEAYTKVPSIEIWSDDTVNSTIKQIEFYWESGVFKSKEDALAICAELNQMLLRISKQAELNTKLIKNGKASNEVQNYSLYHSDVMIGNNCILAKSGTSRASYISCFSFNSMLTRNQSFCNETEIWLKNLIRKSNLISGVAEKQRYRYFKKIDELMRKLIAKIEVD
jgi:hypothetical protein